MTEVADWCRPGALAVVTELYPLPHLGKTTHQQGRLPCPGLVLRVRAVSVTRDWVISQDYGGFDPVELRQPTPDEEAAWRLSTK